MSVEITKRDDFIDEEDFGKPIAVLDQKYTRRLIAHSEFPRREQLLDTCIARSTPNADGVPADPSARFQVGESIRCVYDCETPSGIGAVAGHEYIVSNVDGVMVEIITAHGVIGCMAGYFRKQADIESGGRLGTAISDSTPNADGTHSVVVAIDPVG